MSKVVERALITLAVAMLAAACNTSSPDSCKVTCVADSECPDGQTCGELGLCTAGEACPCEAGEFRGCDGDAARFCNATANGLEAEACAAGCNADAGRCNLCVPSADTCIADNTMVEHCGADGLPASTTTCRLDCVPEGAAPAHCGYLEPLFFPDLCDDLATSAELTLAEVTLDTSADATCDGGILTQTGGPEVCVIRHSKITIGDNVLVRGGRAIAFVADEGVLVQGLLDVSADGTSGGPGSTGGSGARAGVASGGGGAGFGSTGGAGGGIGSAGTTGTGGVGGTAVDPLATLIFAGGASPLGPTFQQQQKFYPYPGGGGGAVMLLACRGDVSVTGTINAGGGGGQGGKDVAVGTALSFVGGTGGGTGGYVLMQAIEIRLSSIGQEGIFANGGGGGGGCIGDSCNGQNGFDALASVLGGANGRSDNAGDGGSGGDLDGKAGDPGENDMNSPGGGGGAGGRIQIAYPASGSAATNATTSPSLLPSVTLSTR